MTGSEALCSTHTSLRHKYSCPSVCTRTSYGEVTRICRHALCGLPDALVLAGVVKAVALATGSGVPDAAAERVACG